MRTYHFVLESLFMLTTIVLTLELFIIGEWGYFTALWWAILGILQVSHSLVLGMRYWANKVIRNSITLYWKFVLINFAILGLSMVLINGSGKYGDDWARKLLDNIYFATIVIFPALLALFFWYITFRHRITKPTHNTGIMIDR